MGPPSSCSGVQFPGTDGRSAHLDAADWLPHAVTSLRLEIGPPHRAARAVLTPPPRNLQRSRDQTARAGSLFNTSECVAAQRLQFVGVPPPPESWGYEFVRIYPSIPSFLPPRSSSGWRQSQNSAMDGVCTKARKCSLEWD
ncbi:Little elongation complex subunit 1 [Manis javanica]|nr:Little elongation complex subunit 1 [Manis javanica]